MRCSSSVFEQGSITWSRAFFFFSSLLLSSLELSDTKVYKPEIRARLGTAAHFCEVVIHPIMAPTTRLSANGSKGGVGSLLWVGNSVVNSDVHAAWDPHSSRTLRGST